jgi:DNA-binding LacI/PurR family transcriptional regulator
MPTIKDVAQAAGVSTATVSYVLNHTKQVSPEIERRVLETARALNYRANAAARNLRKQENCIIGYELPMFIEGDVGTMMHQFIYALAVAAENAGYHLMTFVPDADRSMLDSYQQMIHSQRVDGFVISNTTWDDERIELLLDLDVPFVAFGRANDEFEFAYVDVDGYDGMRQVAEHLLGLGHERFGFIGWPHGSVSGDARFNGYNDTLQEAGIVMPDAMDLRVWNRVDEGYAAAQTLMSAPTPPTAIVCVSDVLAVGAMRYLTAHNTCVGTDVAVSGFDDIALSEFLSPPLTTVHQPLEAIGEQLIQMLLTHINKEGIPAREQQVMLKPQLIVRESTVPNIT